MYSRCDQDLTVQTLCATVTSFACTAFNFFGKMWEQVSASNLQLPHPTTRKCKFEGKPSKICPGYVVTCSNIAGTPHWPGDFKLQPAFCQPARCWPRPPAHQPPAASQPTLKSTGLNLALSPLHILSRRAPTRPRDRKRCKTKKIYRNPQVLHNPDALRQTNWLPQWYDWANKSGDQSSNECCADARLTGLRRQFLKQCTCSRKSARSSCKQLFRHERLQLLRHLPTMVWSFAWVVHPRRKRAGVVAKAALRSIFQYLLAWKKCVLSPRSCTAVLQWAMKSRSRGPTCAAGSRFCRSLRSEVCMRKRQPSLGREPRRKVGNYKQLVRQMPLLCTKFDELVRLHHPSVSICSHFLPITPTLQSRTLFKFSRPIRC